MTHFHVKGFLISLISWAHSFIKDELIWILSSLMQELMWRETVKSKQAWNEFRGETEGSALREALSILYEVHYRKNYYSFSRVKLLGNVNFSRLVYIASYLSFYLKKTYSLQEFL